MSAKFDLFSHTKEFLGLAFQALASETEGEIIDMSGFESLQYAIQSREVTSDSVFKLEHGDESDLSDASDVDASDLINGGQGLEFSTSDTTTVKGVGYRGKKRYVRLSFVSGDMTAGSVAILGRPHLVPTQR